MKKITSFIAAAFIAVTTFTSCEVEKSANNLVGTWELKSTTVHYENGDTKLLNHRMENGRDILSPKVQLQSPQTKHLQPYLSPISWKTMISSSEHTELALNWKLTN